MRFVAGENLDDAVAVARRLNDLGMAASLDHLGESVGDEAVSRRAAGVYMRTLDRIAGDGLDASISVKLTQLGVDVSSGLCHELMAKVCARAAGTGRDVTIDMESSDYTDVTVGLVLALREEGFDNVGCAVQTYLRRTPADVDRLVGSGASLRLCKGAYLEPAEIAYTSKREIDEAFVRLAEQLLESGTYPLIATHDHRIIHHVKNHVRRIGLGRDDFEFQMLYGVREPLQRALVRDGYRLRVYVPFGSEWYPYFMRRLAERPANLAFFLRALAGRRA
jgi:proline dehydrogenase